MPSNAVTTGSYLNRARKTFITLATFNNDFFAYSTSFNSQSFSYTGSLLTFASSANCPKGRILHENGKKLYPEANPGVATFMIGVYDPVSFLSGFIDPNSPIFTPVNQDKPTYIDNGIDPGPGGQTDRAPPVFTRGKVICQNNVETDANVLAEGNVTADGNVTAGGNANVGGEVTAVGQIRSTTITNITADGSTTISFNPILGQVFKVSAVEGTTTTFTASSTPAGAVMYIIITGVENAGSTLGYAIIDYNGVFRSTNISEGGAGRRQINLNSVYTYMYVSDGTAFYQVGEERVLAI